MSGSFPVNLLDLLGVIHPFVACLDVDDDIIIARADVTYFYIFHWMNNFL